MNLFSNLLSALDFPTVWLERTSSPHHLVRCLSNNVAFLITNVVRGISMPSKANILASALFNAVKSFYGA